MLHEHGVVMSVACSGFGAVAVWLSSQYLSE